MGHSLQLWRQLVCLPLITIVPVSLLSQESAPALLRSSGGALVNKNSAPASIAIFPTDLIEIPKGAMARIEASGSSVDIHPESMVQYNTDELVLDHGSVSVNTARGLKVRVGCVTVTPENSADWTRYDVVDVDGKVTVAALKGDVYLDSHSNNPQPARHSAESNRMIVREGEQKSRSEKCGSGSRPTPTDGAILNSPYAIGAGVGVVIGVTCWALCRGGAPVSPAIP
jgi:hypothetical protein